MTPAGATQAVARSANLQNVAKPRRSRSLRRRGRPLRRPVVARPSPSGAMEGDSFSSRSSTSSHLPHRGPSSPPQPGAVRRRTAADPSSSSSSSSSSASFASSIPLSSPSSFFCATVYGDSRRYGCRSPYGKKLKPALHRGSSSFFRSFSPFYPRLSSLRPPSPALSFCPSLPSS